MARKPIVHHVEAVEPIVQAPAINPNRITNTSRGTTVHLGDGRKLAPGESAEVPVAEAAQLREAGLVA